MGKGVDRTEILRMDCPPCHGNGYIARNGGEEFCEDCGGTGMLEKEVPFKFDGERTVEEKAEAFGVSVEQYRDAGHDGTRPSGGGGMSSDE